MHKDVNQLKKALRRMRIPPPISAPTIYPLCFDRGETLLNLHTQQGFRKYLTKAQDHEELLSFLLGQIVKEKARFFRLQRHQQPKLVTVNTSEVDKRVYDCVVLDMPHTQLVDDDNS